VFYERCQSAAPLCIAIKALKKAMMMMMMMMMMMITAVTGIKCIVVIFTQSGAQVMHHKEN
jgi:hypothetical protein